MEDLMKQVGETGGILVLLIPAIVQMLKKVPYLVKLNNESLPVYDLLSLGLGIGGAFALGLPAPIVTGIVSGLAASKGYDFAKQKTTNK